MVGESDTPCLHNLVRCCPHHLLVDSGGICWFDLQHYFPHPPPPVLELHPESSFGNFGCYHGPAPFSPVVCFDVGVAHHFET